MDTLERRETPSSPLIEPIDGNTGLSTAAKIGIGVGVLIGIVVLVLVLVFLLNHPGATETVRDLFIIVLAFESLVIGTLLVILVYQLIVLIRMLRDDLRPMIESTQETVNTVKGTATFVSDRVTKPAIAASGYFTGIGRSIRVLLALLPRRSSARPFPSPTKEAAGESLEEGQGG